MDLSHDLYQHLSRDWDAQTQVKEVPCTASSAKRHSTGTASSLAPQNPSSYKERIHLDGHNDASAIAVSR